MRAHVGLIAVLLLGLALLGCGRENSATAGQGAAQPALQAASSIPAAGGGVEIELDDADAKKVVLDAEKGRIVKPMAVYSDGSPPAGVKGPKGASGGKYVETAEPVEKDPATGKRKELHGGATTLTFDAPEAGKYYIWVRVWWRHGCANSYSIGLDGMPGMMKRAKPHQITDSTFGKWRWLAVGRSVLRPAAIRLAKGRHTLTLTSREDGSALDQVLVVNDPDYVPTGPEKP